jgi:epoxyqueuosine reductase
MSEGTESLRGRLRALGFDEVRFASADGPPSSGLREWLSAGMQGEMHWMERSAEKRLDAASVLPGVQSVILLGVNYWDGLPPAADGRPVWARYAGHADYHDTIKPALVAAGRILESELGIGPDDYRYYVDTGPVLERGWAARAGVGFIGKNTMLVSREHGNWLLLSAILVRAGLAPDSPVRRTDPARTAPHGVGLLCGSCTRCLDACPTQAFPAPGVLDARRCISYQTIENKGVIPRELRPAIGARIYGCDVCLEVCPWNRFAQAGRRTLLEVRDEIGGLSLKDILELTPERFAVVFRGTGVKRLKLAGLLRNACVAAGNSGDRTLLGGLIALSAHPAGLVRAHAVWAVRRLAPEEWVSMLAATRGQETDPAVLEEYAAA